MLKIEGSQVGYSWELYVGQESEDAVAICSSLPLPSVGDIIFHEHVNGPMEVKSRTWSLRDGYPLVIEVRCW